MCAFIYNITVFGEKTYSRSDQMAIETIIKVRNCSRRILAESSRKNKQTEHEHQKGQGQRRYRRMVVSDLQKVYLQASRRATPKELPNRVCEGFQSSAGPARPPSRRVRHNPEGKEHRQTGMSG